MTNATRSYSVSLNILEFAYGVLRRSGLMDLARPLMHAVSDAHGVSVYLSKVLGPSSLLLLDWVGRRLPHRSIRHRGAPVPRSGGRIGRSHGGVRQQPRGRTRSAVLASRLVPETVVCRVSGPRQRSKKAGFAVDRGAMFQGITLVSVPVLSPSWEPLLILTGAGTIARPGGRRRSESLGRAMQSAAARPSESVRLLRLGEVTSSDRVIVSTEDKDGYLATTPEVRGQEARWISTPSSSAPVSPASTSSTSCANSASRCACSKPAPASAAPGTGTAIPAPASIPKAGPTAIPSRRNCSTNGTGRSISRASPRPSVI